MLCNVHADLKATWALTSLALIAALLYFVLCQFVNKKTILLANVTGNLMMQIYLMAVCSLPSHSAFGQNSDRS